MKIGIIAHPFGEKYPAGLERFVRDATDALIRASRTDEFIIFTKRPVPENEQHKASCTYVSYGYNRLWLDRTLRRGPRADVYVFFTPMMPLFFHVSRSVVFVLDFSYISIGHTTPTQLLKLLLLKFAHRRAIRRATRVVAISEATAQTLSTLHWRTQHEVRVLYPGVRDWQHISPRALPLPETYVLFVGALKERKNVRRIVEAYLQARPRVPSCKLVIVGNGTGGYANELHAYVHMHHAADDIFFLGHIDDAALRYAYEHAIGVIYPSLIEGFGFPIVEAMQLGVPVVTSNIGALKEVAGTAALLVDPYDVGDIAEGIVRIVESDATRSAFREKGRQRARMFSWDTFGAQFLQTLYDAS